MMSGILYWDSGLLGSRGTGGYFWSSTHYSYTDSHYLNFYSTSVYSKSGRNKPSGIALRCVAFQSSPQHALKSSLNPVKSLFLRRNKV
ncbi:hypothetical protein IKF63_02790 [Candidatus Saccharibacteria bacterium]|nr:hypothetical protein [Candidatus Saccharibacteria bacterium]